MPERKQKPYMKYRGGAFLGGIPSRDLTREEAESHGVEYLLKTGLYELVVEPKKSHKDESQTDSEVTND